MRLITRLKPGIILALLGAALLVLRVTGVRAQWTEDGAALGTVTGGSDFPRSSHTVCRRATVTWEDWRSGNYDIYTQRVTHDGGIMSELLPALSIAIVVIALAIGSLSLRKLLRGGAIQASRCR